MSVAEIVMVPVTSSTIESYSWTAGKKATGTLFVKFKNGSTYRYDSVTTDAYNGFVGAESKGKYFSANIRNKFVATKQ